MPSIKSFIVVVGRYSASGFCFAQLTQNRRETKAEKKGKRSIDQTGDALLRERRALHEKFDNWPVDRVRRLIEPRKLAQFSLRAH